MTKWRTTETYEAITSDKAETQMDDQREPATFSPILAKMLGEIAPDLVVDESFVKEIAKHVT